MKNLDRKLLNKFLKIAGEKLSGDWLLVGGTVMPLLGIGKRVTQDIDIVGFGTAERAQSLELIEIAEKLKLPIESINQAAGFFLSKIPNWKENLILIEDGRRARIYRPDINLFLCLKIQRLTETDLEDCIEFLKYSRRKNETLDRNLILKAIKKRETGEVSDALLNRLRILDRMVK